jgi:UDP-N-acetylglucosamine 2-epimerase (non-hydrolysing)
MPYTHRSKENLLREGIERQRIFVIGNPIYEVLEAYQRQIQSSPVLETLSISPKQYFLVTLHRAENVDDPMRLERLLRGLALVADTYHEPMVVSLHPRTADKLSTFGLDPHSERVRLLDPLGFFDFVRLEGGAHCVLSDSGTVQEECCIMGVPNVTVRDVTERAETVEVGSNILSGAQPETMLQAVKVALETSSSWKPPVEYVEPKVSTAVAKIVMGYHHSSPVQKA